MDTRTEGWLNGFVGMLVFSGSLPATRIAVQELDPLFLTGIRAVIAALAASILLVAARARLPAASDLAALAIVALGVVFGFPLLTALALQFLRSTQAIIFIGLLPAATALAGACLGGERPSRAFWACSLAGSAIVAAYALGSGAPGGWVGPALMLIAVAVCGLGYASGAVLSRRLGGWQVVSWALVLSLPFSAALTAASLPLAVPDLSLRAGLALGYVSLFSMLIGFVFWYRGLACGGIAAVGQLQLLQPLFGVAIAAALLHEPVGWPLLAAMLGVIACVAGARHYAPRPVARP